MIVRPETQDDRAAISQLIGVVMSPAEARLVDRLRDEAYVLASLVAIRDSRVVGNIVFSRAPIVTDNRAIEAAALAPLVVHPQYQRLGIGSALVTEGLRICKQLGQEAVIVLGDPKYYSKFGFRSDLTNGIVCKYSGPACMGLELTPNVLQGAIGSMRYPPAFDELD